jgi:hypothetical protein
MDLFNSRVDGRLVRLLPLGDGLSVQRCLHLPAPPVLTPRAVVLQWAVGLRSRFRGLFRARRDRWISPPRVFRKPRQAFASAVRGAYRFAIRNPGMPLLSNARSQEASSSLESRYRWHASSRVISPARMATTTAAFRRDDHLFVSGGGSTSPSVERLGLVIDCVFITELTCSRFGKSFRAGLKTPGIYLYSKPT